ncbi:alpha/beta hydrolase-fold protein [Thalassotalea fonticola]|uniref:Alpha/beta hydrolase-fold protein n=1 Tax=Thalassotalea fonticola TaxID=3065649 RepID=A0ABZ0GLT6_9GAMM|nr:alpha/beta hydrolase-fold protein [Colwelliaceae bacterium S1-1]
MMRLLLILTLHFIGVAQAKEAIVAGYVDSHHSDILKQDRRFMIGLPENYHDNALSYPTLYVIDGDFQFQHVSAVVKNLSRMGKIPPMIVIGIATQGNADYIYQTTWRIKGEQDYGGASTFYQYITDELIPYIDDNYRSNSNRIMSGYSLGGLFTTYTMVQNNTPFNAFLAMSPSYWFDDYSAEKSIANYIGEYYRQYKNPPSPLFLSVANEQGMGVDKVYKSLNEQNINDWKLIYKQYPDENHFSTALPALHDALGYLFAGYYEDGYELQAHKDVFAVLATFENKKKNYNGFRIEWLQAYKFSKYVFGSKQTDKIEEILTIINQQFPNSIVNVTNYLAKGFNAKKQFQKAQDILDRVKAEGAKIALWHHQYSLALAGLGQIELADKAQTKAMTLAQQQKLPMWQIWEMK